MNTVNCLVDEMDEGNLPPLKFLTIYNNYSATKNIQFPDKPLRCKAFWELFTLSAAGYIAPRVL